MNHSIYGYCITASTAAFVGAGSSIFSFLSFLTNQFTPHAVPHNHVSHFPQGATTICHVIGWIGQRPTGVLGDVPVEVEM